MLAVQYVYDPTFPAKELVAAGQLTSILAWPGKYSLRIVPSSLQHDVVTFQLDQRHAWVPYFDDGMLYSFGTAIRLGISCHVPFHCVTDTIFP